MRTLLSLFLVVGLVSAAQAVPGDPDATFSPSDGKVFTNVGGNGGANAVAIQADGKIVVAGFVSTQLAATAGEFAVARFLASGTLDTSFGVNGIARTAFADGPAAAAAIAVQPDGRIVVAGSACPRLAIARYLTNGTPDPEFNNGQPVSRSFGPGGGGATGLALQPDGGIVVVGSVDGIPEKDFAIARFTPGGILDTGSLPSNFGPPDPVTGIRPGIVTKDLGGRDTATAVALDPNGNILVAGGSVINIPDCTPSCFAVVRFTPAGVESFPLSFDARRTPGTGSATAITLQPDGKFVVAGETGAAVKTMVIARYDGDGALDPSFVGDGALDPGIVRIDFGASTRATTVAVQLDGKIVVAGSASQATGPQNINFALVRLNSNGTLDLGFNGDGKVITDFSADGTTRNDSASAIAIQDSDGRIVVAGSTEPTTSVDKRFAIARYHAFVCNGANVTILGNNSSETLFGQINRGQVADVIHGLGGNDTIDGRGANDIICGGEGDDTLFGGSGNDTLIAGTGRDHLDGGFGNDTCVGGDTFNLCESEGRGLSGFSGEWLEVFQKCTRSKHHPSCTLRGSLRVFNPGVEATPVRSQVAFYLSEDDRLDGNDTLLTTKRIRRLASGGERIIELDVKLRGVDDLSSLFVIAVLDPFDTVPEVNEENNVVVSPPVSKHRVAGGPEKKR